MTQELLISLTDQVASATKDVFAEFGLSVDVEIPNASHGGMKFKLTPKDGTVLTQEIVDSVVEEALLRCGAKRSE